MERGRHERAGSRGYRRAAVVVVVCYLVAGALWYGAWVNDLTQTRGFSWPWTALLLAPVVGTQAVTARRLLTGSTWRYLLAQVLVPAAVVAVAWVGTLSGAMLTWFVVWSAVEPRVLGFVAFYGAAVRAGLPSFRRIWA